KGCRRYAVSQFSDSVVLEAVTKQFSTLCYFFFQAEDGIRDGHVTGVQTCPLPICRGQRFPQGRLGDRLSVPAPMEERAGGVGAEIGRASCRERVKCSVDGEAFEIIYKRRW